MLVDTTTAMTTMRFKDLTRPSVIGGTPQETSKALRAIEKALGELRNLTGPNSRETISTVAENRPAYHVHRGNIDGYLKTMLGEDLDTMRRAIQAHHEAERLDHVANPNESSNAKDRPRL